MANISIQEPSDLLDDERSFPVERTSEKVLEYKPMVWMLPGPEEAVAEDEAVVEDKVMVEERPWWNEFCSNTATWRTRTI